MRQTFNKLVRDGIPAKLDAAGVRYEIRTAAPGELEALLLAKLQEEVDELLGAASDDEALEEIADISEVLAALATRHGANEALLRAKQRAKRDARGGFEEGIVLCWTESA